MSKMNEPAKEKKKSKSGLILIGILVALFALPEIIAVTLRIIEWRPESSSNKGDLVVPARPISDVKLKTIDGEVLTIASLKGKWVMVYFSNSDCDDPCKQNVYAMRQVQTALGKEKGRVQRLLVLSGKSTIDTLKAKIKDYAGMYTVVDQENIEALTQQFLLNNASSVATDRIYLIDPLGNLMMTYKDDPRGILKDLIHLMKISWSG